MLTSPCCRSKPGTAAQRSNAASRSRLVYAPPEPTTRQTTTRATTTAHKSKAPQQQVASTSVAPRPLALSCAADSARAAGPTSPGLAASTLPRLPNTLNGQRRRAPYSPTYPVIIKEGKERETEGNARAWRQRQRERWRGTGPTGGRWASQQSHSRYRRRRRRRWWRRRWRQGGIPYIYGLHGVGGDRLVWWSAAMRSSQPTSGVWHTHKWHSI